MWQHFSVVSIRQQRYEVVVFIRKDCVGVFSLKKLRVIKVRNLLISTLAAVTPDSESGIKNITRKKLKFLAEFSLFAVYCRHASSVRYTGEL